MQWSPKVTTNSQRRETRDAGTKGGVSFMSHHMHGKAGYQPTTVMRPRASAGIRLNPFPNKSPQVMPPSPGPTMNKQNSHHEPRRRSLVNTQQPRKETPPEFFSGHVAPASHAHKQVTSTKTADQATKEPPGHTSGHQ
jgi:hypothetical protein